MLRAQLDMQRKPTEAKLEIPSFNLPNIFGDFGMLPETTLAELAHHYGAEAKDAAPETSIGALFMKEFHDQPAVGDRMNLGPVEIVVEMSLSTAGCSGS